MRLRASSRPFLWLVALLALAAPALPAVATVAATGVAAHDASAADDAGAEASEPRPEPTIQAFGFRPDGAPARPRIAPAARTIPGSCDDEHPCSAAPVADAAAPSAAAPRVARWHPCVCRDAPAARAATGHGPRGPPRG